MKPIKNINVVEHSECCGCSSCYNICPVNAITMIPDSEGFLYPEVDEEKCTNCGLCQIGCPSLDPKYHNTHEPECYAVLADDEVRKVSSSGGMFTLLADYVFSQNGYVCGAAYGKDFKVEHIIINTPEEMHRLRGSKYVQSDIGTVYKDIKDLLQEGNWVLFSGCPCQIAGLYSYLRKDYEYLITVDLICHGVPSPLTFEKYLNEDYKDKEIEKIDFRDKDVFGWSTEMNIYFKDGTRHVERSGKDPYYRAFLPCLGMRPFCGTCKFTTLPRQADLSIGDFWGIGKYRKDLDDRKGTSLVLVNNKKGAEIFNIIKENVKAFDKMPIETARPRNYTIDKPFKPHPHRKRFFELLKQYPFDKAVEFAIRRKFDVAIMGLWFGRNYGSMATYYALHQVIKSMGLSVLMIDNPLRPSIESIQTKTHPRRFGRQYYEISKVYPLHQLKELNEYCDTFIIGSDQLWNYDLSRPYGQAYFLGFVDDNKKKIAYGTSFGKENYNGPEAQRILTQKNLKRFDAISVREDFAVNICQNTFDVKAVNVIDPVFLCEAKNYDNLIKDANQTERNYISAYILDTDNDKKDALKYVAERLNKEVCIILDEEPVQWENNKKRLGLSDDDTMLNVKEEVDLKEWLSYLKNSDFIVTDSFHGCCFAILFRKPFIGIRNNKRGGGRFHSLLSRYQLLDRLVSDPKEIYENDRLFESIDYDKVYKIINEDRNFSLQWLKDAIFSSKETKNFTAYPTIDERLNDK